MTFISLSTILVRKEYLAKMNNLTNHHCAGSPKALGPMQLHELPRLKAGPGSGLRKTVCKSEIKRFIKFLSQINTF